MHSMHVHYGKRPVWPCQRSYTWPIFELDVIRLTSSIYVQGCIILPLKSFLTYRENRRTDRWTYRTISIKHSFGILDKLMYVYASISQECVRCTFVHVHCVASYVLCASALCKLQFDQVKGQVGDPSSNSMFFLTTSIMYNCAKFHHSASNRSWLIVKTDGQTDRHKVIPSEHFIKRQVIMKSAIFHTRWLHWHYFCGKCLENALSWTETRLPDIGKLSWLFQDAGNTK